MLLEGGHRLIKSNYTVTSEQTLKFSLFLENVIDMLSRENGILQNTKL